MFHRRQLSHQGVGHDGGCAGTFGGLIFFDIWSATQVGDNTLSKDCTSAPAQTRLCWAGALILLFWQHRTIPALRLKHRSGSCGTASALPKCSIMSGCGTRIVLRGAKAPRTLRPLPLLRFAVSATGGAHLCSIQYYLRFWLGICRTSLAVSALRIMRYCLLFISCPIGT